MKSKATSFGQWLKQRRKVLGLTQKDLARQAGCAEVTVRKIETGDLPPSAPLAAALAKAAGASEADLPGLVALARGADDNFTARERLLRPQRPNNLIAQLTPLIGRERDIAAVRKRLLSDGTRLITLLGPPGVGKTRLAQAVAEDVLEHFEHGVFFVRLAPISDPDQVASAIAQALGLQMSGPNPPELQLRAFLEEKHLLLILDNFEQILAAAPLLDNLLRRCPWLHVLVTSRQPLRVRGERQIPVLPLDLPAALQGASKLKAVDALRYSAVALFAERAEAVQSDFAVNDGNAAAVAELCRRLDGLPLAIELVAARVKLLPPAELVARLRGPWLLSMDGLRDVSARQKTLRGAIGWSYDLLTPTEQTLFTRLAVFAGGCTLQAAQMLCGEHLAPTLPLSLTPTQVLDGIASLLDRSLLHRETGLHGDSRYVMLETVREYGLELGTSSGQETALRKRHAECLLQLIEKTEHSGPDFAFFQVRYLVDDEIHNMRAALAWAMDHDVEVALLLTAPMLHWIIRQGPLQEATRLMDEVFALPGALAPTISRAKTLIEVGFLMSSCLEDSKAQKFLEECLRLSQELGYVKGEADALLWLGYVAFNNRQDQGKGDYYLERALASYRNIGDPEGISITLVFLAEIANCRLDYDRAYALSEESLAVAKQAGYRFSWPLCKLGETAFALGDLDLARSQYEQALAIERKRGSTGTDLSTLHCVAELATYQGDFSAAQVLVDEMLARTRCRGVDGNYYHCLCCLLSALIAQGQVNHSSAIRWYRASLSGLRYIRTEWSALGLGLAALSQDLGEHGLAAMLLGATDGSDIQDYRITPFLRNDYNHLAEAARAHFGEASFQDAWTDGRERSFEQVVEEAVSILEKTLRVQDQAPPA